MNVVSKKPIIGGIILAAIIGVVFAGAQINPDNPENEEVVFHVTLAYGEASIFDDFWGEDKVFQSRPHYMCLQDGYMTKLTCSEKVYAEKKNLEAGVYLFKFVASGDSPKTLEVTVREGEELKHESNSSLPLRDHFHETFVLKGTPNDWQSETPLYYTWDYDGQKEFEMVKWVPITIIIDPNGNYNGPISVDLIKLR